MPVILKSDSRRRIVLSKFYGRVTDDEVISHRHTIAIDPDFRPEFDDVVDFCDVTEFLISDGTLAQIAKSQSVFNPDVRHVIIAPPGLAADLATRFRTFAQSTRSNVFLVHDRKAAYGLLNVTSDAEN